MLQCYIHLFLKFEDETASKFWIMMNFNFA